MTVSVPDIKKLWGLAGGRCSKPGCGVSCVELFAESSVVTGEMAHVIGRSASGPRPDGHGGDDSYENLILLCPTHHRLVDKAPSEFPVELLHSWKDAHEERVRKSFEVRAYASRTELFEALRRLLIETKAVWRAYGPESDAAKSNPISNLVDVWTLRKLTEIVPKNRKICKLIDTNRDLLTTGEYATAAAFVEHAAGFEESCYARRENVPRFPPAFEEMVFNDG